MQRGLSVKRWDGSARIMSGWDSLRKVSPQQLYLLNFQHQDRHADRSRTRNYGTRMATASYTCMRRAGRKGGPPLRSPSHVSCLPSARF